MPSLEIDINVSGADQAEREFEKVGTAADKAGSQASGAAKGFKAIGTAVSGIGLMTSGVFGLVDAQDDLEKSENTAAKTRRRASEATEKRVKAEKALADAMSGTGAQMELQIPAGKEFVQMWSDTEVQVRNANGELSVMPAKYKQIGGATKSVAQLQDDYNDALENEKIAHERAELATKADRKEHERIGIEYAKNAGQIAAGAGMFLPWIESAKNMVKEGSPMVQTLGKVAGAAGLVGLAVGGAAIASEELAAARMADPKFAERLAKETKQLEKQSVAQAAVNTLTQDVPKVFADIGRELDKIPAIKTVRLAVQDFLSDPLGTIVEALDKIPGFKEVRLAVQDFLSDPLGTIVEALDKIPGFKEVRLAVQDFLSDPLGSIVEALDKIPGFKEVRLAVQDFLSDPLGTITDLLDKIPGFKEVRLAVQDFLSDPLGTITDLLDKIPGFKEVRLAVQDFLSDPLGTIVETLDKIPGFKEVRLAVQDFLSDPLGTILETLDKIPGFKDIRLALQDFASDALSTIQAAIDRIPILKSIQVALQDFASDPLGTIQAAIDRIPFLKSIQIALQDFASNPLGTIQAAIDRIPFLKSIQIALQDFASNPLGTIQAAIDRIPLLKSIQMTLQDLASTGLSTIQTAITNIPARKDITISANSSVAVQAIMEVGRALGLIPPEKKTTVTAETAAAQRDIGAVTSSLNGIPQTKSFTVDAKTGTAQNNLSLVDQAINELKDKTVTVTVNVKGGANAGAMGVGKGSIGFRHGGTNIVSKPTNIRVGEGFHPELVSVTPLGKTGGGGTGPAAHPHAATGGSFVSGLGGMVSSIMNNAVKSIAQDIKTETQRVEDRKFLLFMDRYNMLLRETQALVRKTAEEAAKAQKVLSAGLANPKSSGAAIAAQTRAVAQANQDYANAQSKLAKLMANRPEPPVVNVTVTGAAKGFGPAMVRKPTVFMAGEAGPEMVNVVPMGKGTRSSGGMAISSEQIGRLADAVDKLARSTNNRAMEANLIVDGQRMANVSQKYIGTKSYGDR